MPDEDETPKRQTWDKKIEYTLSAIGYAVGLGNVWRFPYICYNNGGGAFLFPYFIMVILVGLPVFFIESGLGQFTSKGPLGAYDCVRGFKGLGYGMFAISVLIGIYYNVVLSWTLYFIYNSFSLNLPWSYCPDDNAYCLADTAAKNSLNATSWNQSCYTTAAENFFDTTILGKVRQPCNETLFDELKANMNKDHVLSSYANVSHEYDKNVFDVGAIHWPLVVTLILTIVSTGLCIWKGIKASGKVMYVITLFPYVALSVLLIKGLTLPGALDGIGYYIKPDFSKLMEVKIWKEATGQIFYSTSLAMGGVVTLCSFNGFRNDLITDAYIVVLADAGTSIFGGFIIFAFLGYMAESMHLPIDQVVTGGPGLTFVVWPEAMAKLGAPWLCAMFAAIFFLMLYSMGISSMIGLTETVVSFFTDLIPSLRRKRGAVVLSVCCVFFLAALPMVCSGGIDYFSTWDNYAATYILLILAFLEVIAVSWIYGTKRFISDIKMMVEKDKQLPSWADSALEWFWRIICPVFILYLLIASIVEYKSSTYSFYGFHFAMQNTQVIATIVLGIPVACVIIGFLMMGRKFGFGKQLLETTEDWGPKNSEDRVEWQGERVDGFVYPNLGGDIAEKDGFVETVT